MRKMLTAGLAALTLGSAVAAAAVPATADARPYYGHYYRHGNGGAAVAAGIAGLAIGAAIADSGRPHYYGYGYGYPGYGSGVCEPRHWAWDPYVGRRVLVTQHYPC